MQISLKETETSYTIADNFLLRIPGMPLEILNELSCDESTESVLKKYFGMPKFREALLMASPDLFDQCIRWEAGALINGDAMKLHRSLLKYLVRMSSRATPFGLFAGVGHGRFSERSAVELSVATPGRLHIRPDMLYLCSLAEAINADKTLRLGLRYMPNSSISQVGCTYRYTEYEIGRGGQLDYRLQMVHIDEALEISLESAKRGAGFGELVSILVDQGVTSDEATEYIHTLIDNQVLVSDIMPRVSGSSYLEEMLVKFDNDKDSDAVRQLTRLSDDIEMVREAGETYNTRFHAIRAMVERSGERNRKHGKGRLFQADASVNILNGELGESIRTQLSGLLPVLMKLARPARHSSLDTFRERLEQRYGGIEVPLAVALDTELGPGYSEAGTGLVSDPLIEGIRINKPAENNRTIDWGVADRFLYRKLQYALLTGADTIDVTEEELPDIDIADRQFPLSFSILARVLGPIGNNPGERLIHVLSAGGSSAVNLAGRFGYMDRGLEQQLREIGSLEQDLAGDALLAEIVHLPQQRTGNILMRPSIRDFEIPFMARASVDPDFQIPVDDLMVSVRNNKIVLRSKRLNRYILPRLSNAHNFSSATLPVYRFLCDMQTQSAISNLSFQWGMPEFENTYLPRVVFKNFILEPARWNIMGAEYDAFTSARTPAAMKAVVRRWKESLRMPDEVMLSAGDNELWLDLSNSAFLSLLQAEVKNAGQFVLKEFISYGGKHSLVRAGSSSFANECLFFVIPEKK